MSMPKIEKSKNCLDREQAINDLIESIALIETALSHIINAEGEKLQKIIKYEEDEEVPIDDLLKVNDSVQKMISTISKLEMVLQGKLDIVKELEDCKEEKKEHKEKKDCKEKKEHKECFNPKKNSFN